MCNDASFVSAARHFDVENEMAAANERQVAVQTGSEDTMDLFIGMVLFSEVDARASVKVSEPERLYDAVRVACRVSGQVSCDEAQLILDATRNTEYAIRHHNEFVWNFKAVDRALSRSGP
jgi:hypothetical protein